MEPDKFRMSREEHEDEMTCQPCTCRTPVEHEPGCAWRQQEERMAARRRERVDRAIVSLDGQITANATPGWRIENPDWPSGEGPHLVPADGDDEPPDPDFAPQVDGSTGEVTSGLPGQGNRAPGEIEGQGEAARPIQDSSQLGGFGVGREGVDEGADHHKQEGQDDGSHAPGGNAGSVPGPRFGERLLIYLDAPEGSPGTSPQGFFTEGINSGDLRAIAAAIDRDATVALEELSDQWRAIDWLTLHRQIEEAVERLRYSTDAVRYSLVESETPHYRGEPHRKDVLDTEPFLEELGAIFGERPEVRSAHPREWSAVVSDLRELAARPLDGEAMRFGPMEARQILIAIGGRPGMGGS